MHFLYFTYDLAAIGGKKERKKKHPASLRKLANVSPAIKKTVGTIELVKKFAGSTRSNSYFFTTTFFFNPPFNFSRSFDEIFLSFYFYFFCAPRYHFSWSNYVIIMLKFRRDENLFNSASWHLINGITMSILILRGKSNTRINTVLTRPEFAQ